MTFFDHFESVRSCGNGSGQWMARCKAHDDRSHSLSIGRRDDKWLLHCHADCYIGAVLACHGLDWNDLFDGEAERNGNGRVNLGKIRDERRPRLDMSGEALLPPEHILIYWREQLSEAFEDRLYALKGWTPLVLASSHVGWDGVRLTIPIYGPKSELVSLVRYLPNGDPKTLCVGRRELYPAPELFDQEDLWLVEGEPDRISGQQLHLSTVAIPGVGKWDETWPERFQGHRVTVCFDCDRQGREAARKWSSALDGAGVENRVIDLAPGVDDGYDIGDALAACTKKGNVPELKTYLANLHVEAWS